jgi:hypothetical protein
LEKFLRDLRFSASSSSSSSSKIFGKNFLEKISRDLTLAGVSGSSADSAVAGGVTCGKSAKNRGKFLGKIFVEISSRVSERKFGAIWGGVGREEG